MNYRDMQQFMFGQLDMHLFWQLSSNAAGLLCKLLYSAKILMEGNFDVFDAFQLDRQNLTHQIV